MAVAFGSASSVAEASTVNTTYPAPSGIQNGDLLLIWHLEFGSTIASTAPATPPSGFAALPGITNPQTPAADARYGIWVWYKIASGESGNYVVSHAACVNRGLMARVTGNDTTAPFSPNPTFNSGIGVPPTSVWTGLTTTVDNCLILALGADNNDTTNNLVAPTGGTPTLVEQVDIGGEYLATGIKTPAGSTSNKTQTNNSASNQTWATALVSIKPAAAAGGGGAVIFTRSSRNIRRALVLISAPGPIALPSFTASAVASANSLAFLQTFSGAPVNATATATMQLSAMVPMAAATATATTNSLVFQPKISLQPASAVASTGSLIFQPLLNLQPASAVASTGSLFFSQVFSANPASASASGTAALVAGLSTYAAKIIGDSPTSFLRLDDETGTTARDVVGTNHGTYVSTPPLVSGLIVNDLDKAHQFIGTDNADEVTIPGFTFTTDCSIEFWFSGWTGAPGSTGGVLMRDHTIAGGWIPFWDSGGLLNCRAGGTNLISAVSAAAARDGGRHHVVMNMSGSNVSVWFDGIQIIAPTAKGANTVALPWHVARNGASTPGAGVYAQGNVTFDEIALYPAALTSAQIRGHYDEGLKQATLFGATATASASGSATLTVSGAAFLVPSSADATASATLTVLTPTLIVLSSSAVASTGSLVFAPVLNLQAANAVASVGTPVFQQIFKAAAASAAASTGTLVFAPILNLQAASAVATTGTLKFQTVLNLQAVNAVASTGTLLFQTILNAQSVSAVASVGTLIFQPKLNLQSASAVASTGALVFQPRLDLQAASAVATTSGNVTIPVTGMQLTFSAVSAVASASITVITPTIISASPASATVITHGRLVSNYEREVLTDGPQMYWALDDAFGKARDASGHAREGVYTGGFTLGGSGVPKIGDKALTFTGSSGGRVVSSYSPFSNAGAQTFEGWIYQRSSSAGPLFCGTGADTIEPYLWMFNDSNWAWYPQDASRVDFNFSTFLGTVSYLNTWIHWALIFDPTTNYVTLFVNGAEVGVFDAGGAAQDYNSPGNFILGANAIGAYSTTHSHSHVAVYDYALTPARIRAHYLAGTEQLALNAASVVASATANVAIPVTGAAITAQAASASASASTILVVRPLLGLTALATASASLRITPMQEKDFDLEGFYDAGVPGSITATGADVTQLADQSPKGRNLTPEFPAGGHLPKTGLAKIGGRNALSYDGNYQSQLRYTPGVTKAQPVTVFCVFRCGDPLVASERDVVAWTGDNSISIYKRGVPSFIAYAGNESIMALADGKNHIVIVGFDGASSWATFDGVAVAGFGNPGTPGWAGGSQTFAMGSGNLLNAGWLGEIGSVGVINGSISLAERDALFKILYGKWGALELSAASASASSSAALYTPQVISATASATASTQTLVFQPTLNLQPASAVLTTGSLGFQPILKLQAASAVALGLGTVSRPEKFSVNAASAVATTSSNLFIPVTGIQLAWAANSAQATGNSVSFITGAPISATSSATLTATFVVKVKTQIPLNAANAVASGKARVTPMQLSDFTLLALFDASDISSITASGTDVTQINEKSGAGLDATPEYPSSGHLPQTGVNKLGGKNALSFDGDWQGGLQTARVTIPQPVTVFVVFRLRIVEESLERDVLTWEGGSNPTIYESAATPTRFSVWAGNEIPLDLPDTENHILVAAFDGASSWVTIDGANPVTGDTGTGGWVNERIGIGGGSVVGAGWFGEIGTLGIVQGDLSLVERDFLFRLLWRQWGALETTGSSSVLDATFQLAQTIPLNSADASADTELLTWQPMMLFLSANASMDATAQPTTVGGMVFQPASAVATANALVTITPYITASANLTASATARLAAVFVPNPVDLTASATAVISRPETLEFDLVILQSDTIATVFTPEILDLVPAFAQVLVSATIFTPISLGEISASAAQASASGSLEISVRPIIFCTTSAEASASFRLSSIVPLQAALAVASGGTITITRSEPLPFAPATAALTTSGLVAVTTLVPLSASTAVSSATAILVPFLFCTTTATASTSGSVFIPAVETQIVATAVTAALSATLSLAPVVRATGTAAASGTALITRREPVPSFPNNATASATFSFSVATVLTFSTSSAVFSSTMGLAHEALLPFFSANPTASGSWVFTPFGIMTEITVVPITSKVSTITGPPEAVFSWVSGDNFEEYVVKAVPTAGSLHTAGTPIPTTHGSVNMASVAGGFPGNTTVTSKINVLDLDAAAHGDGRKIIKVFVRNSGGSWST